MNSMFYGCSSLINLDLSNFNTSKVINMPDMFISCKALIVLDLSSFDTSNVETMNGMFALCNNIKTIYVSNKWNTSNVTNSNNMFLNNASLSGAVPFDSTKTDVSMANYTNGYLTYKASSN